MASYNILVDNNQLMKTESPIKKTSLQITNPKLSQDFILKVISLEEKCRKTNSEECILELVKSYSKIIQHYNSIQDNMAIYFTEKMQILLASQKTIDIIDKTQEALTASMNISDAMEMGDLQKDSKIAVKQQRKYDVESKKKQRSKMVKMFIEIKKTKKRANAANILNSYYKECLQNDSLIKNQLQIQRRDLQDKLKGAFRKSKFQKSFEEIIATKSPTQKSLNDSTVESIYIN